MDGQVYTTLVTDPYSSVVRVSQSRPGEQAVIARLSPSGVSKNPDDLTVGPDHRLYVAAYGSGELYRVDLFSGRSCVLLSGLDRPISARFARSFGRPGDLYVTQAAGSVLRVRF